MVVMKKIRHFWVWIGPACSSPMSCWQLLVVSLVLTSVVLVGYFVDVVIENGRVATQPGVHFISPFPAHAAQPQSSPSLTPYWYPHICPLLCQQQMLDCTTGLQSGATAMSMTISVSPVWDEVAGVSKFQPLPNAGHELGCVAGY